ncbi:methyltransferase domain-containing protein [Patescibacteria group bacterium]|nr:methyltransferase domain-containing protein [Patescibacteria group bacterium]MBU1500393.1 methyltransferase domain-containing protein [Patescibacteria group bacterium]
MDKANYGFLPDDDLSDSQIYVTTQTYNRYAKEYAERWEWNQRTIQEIKKYNIKPFTKQVKKNGKVLLVSCQSGRDYFLLSQMGYSCLGVGFAYGLLTEAIKRVPNGLFVRLKLKSLPFMPESFDAVYADALTDVPKKDIKVLLRDFRIFLKPAGVLYLSLLLGKANVMMMNDLGGKRYMTLYRKTEILEIVKSADFDILWSETSLNTDPSLPKWFSLVAKKK